MPLPYRAAAPVILALCAVGPTDLRAQGVTLRELPALARARSERQRPVQLAKLEPFLPDLRTDYRRNSEFLDETIRKVAELGDAVVPLLIDFLTPEHLDDSRDRWLAANSARVLEHLEPRAHLGTWIELLDGEHPLGRRHALRLIRASGPDPRSAAAIVRAFPTLTDPYDIATALRVAEELGVDGLAPLAVPFLESPDADLRASVLEYLTRFRWRDAVDPVVAVLRRETENSLLGRYVAFLRATVERNESVADVLVPLIEGVRLDPSDMRELIAALATIAPEDHRETRRVLIGLLERGETGPLGIRAALTLQDLGEKRGVRILFDKLDDRVRQRRGEAGAFADRADAFFAFDRHRDAIRDYEQAIKFSRTNSRQAAYYLQIARCEAHRDNTRGMLRALKDAGVSAATIRAEAQKDPVFREMLQRDSAQEFLESLGR